MLGPLKSRSALVLGLAVVAVASWFVPQSVTAATQDCFPDVTTADWFHDFVCWMYDNGLVSGYPDGLFKPNNHVTRAEMSVIAKGGFELAEASPGRLKALVYALCNPTPSALSEMYREENNVNGVQITISDGASPTDGRCIIDFGFQVDDRYVVVTTRHPTTALGATIVSLSGGIQPKSLCGMATTAWPPAGPLWSWCIERRG